MLILDICTLCYEALDNSIDYIIFYYMILCYVHGIFTLHGHCFRVAKLAQVMFCLMATLWSCSHGPLRSHPEPASR